MVLVVDGLEVNVGGVARIAVGAAFLVLEAVQAALGRTSAVATGVTARVTTALAVGVGAHLFSFILPQLAGLRLSGSADAGRHDPPAAS